MSAYKIHRKADGSIGGFGPDDVQYQPFLEEGDTLEYSDELPAMPIILEAPPVIISSENITYDDADALCQAMGAGEKTAIWLVAKLEL